MILKLQSIPWHYHRTVAWPIPGFTVWYSDYDGLYYLERGDKIRGPFFGRELAAAARDWKRIL